MPNVFIPTLRRLNILLPKTHRSRLAWICAPLAIAASFLATGTGTPPSIPAIPLAQEPLYAAVTVDKPTIALALSVEYPTVGAQYVTASSTDNTYSTATEYLGYYDAESCYAYNDAPTETVPSGMTAADYKRFDRTGAATSRKCSDGFSGNFLNWASSSAIDMLRLSLSGGDRYIDTPSLTVLQRAVLPNGDPVCMWNSGNFPAKQLSRSSGVANDYSGAVPQAMVTQANGSDIWVANTLNRIYFGTSKTGSCSNTGAYTLGARQSALGPITTSNRLPSGASLCAAENASCTSTGIQEIWYGAQNSWKRAPLSGTTACTNTVFGDPLSGASKACYLVAYTGSWQPSNATGLNSDGFFYSRVQVCNSSGGTLLDNRDYGLCRQYPNGNFKPTGAIQKYSDQMRLAAFGYLMDQTQSYNNGRYGGVLRAPMKYVGTKTFNINGQDNTPTSGNAKAEWNSSTGVFNANPEDDPMQISGVINYLNKFGRTGPVQGRYKRYDPVGELYYQSLRYLQGLQPTQDAISGLTDNLKDGYPVYTSWTDPYGDGRSDTAEYSCLKSNIVVIGDVNTHDGNWRNIDTTDNKAANVPNFRTWHGYVQSFEKNQAVSYKDGQNVTRTTGNPNGANNSVPSSSQTSQIMGYAYWAHTHDIRGADWTINQGDKRRPGLRVKTYVFDVNENGTQNSENTRRYANQFFMAAKYGGFESDAANTGTKPYNTWGNPFKKQDATNDNNVWQKQTTPGEASTYYLQSNARGVLSAFEEIFSRAATSARSISAPAIPSNTVTSTSGAVSYSAKFDTSNWSGDVVAETISVGNNDLLTVSAPTWSASERLTAMTSPATNRKIFVGAGSAISNPTATTFTWGAIGETLKEQLNKSTPTATADSKGELRLNYLRGDRSLEGAPFRVRSSLLGDIVNSNVVYSGAPSKNYSGTGYAAFRTSYDSRTAAVFAGANDGMLHAFNATNGDELFAYVPSWMGRKLPALTDPSFANNHQSYVDAPLEVGEAQVAFAGEASDWKTVLVGGTGAGGSGVFALDVSNPSSFAASNVMWEFTRADDADLGQVIGQPYLIKLKVTNADAATGTAATYRWFAAVASGVNNYAPETTDGPYSSTGNPAIFLLALDKAVGSAWAQGTNYYKITLPADSSLTATQATGLANFSPLYGANGEVTDIFAGDLHGNVWKLTFGDVTPNNWSINNLSYFKSGNNAIPMYVARDGSSTPKVQPITAPPGLFAGPRVNGKDTFYVAIATGKYLELADARNTNTNSFYVLFDNGSPNADSSSPATGAISGRGRLAAGTVNTTTRAVSVSAFKWGRPATSSDNSVRSGWYFDMPDSGERAISKIAAFGSLSAAFNSLIPGSANAAAGSCNNSQGSGNAYVLNIGNGAANYTPSTVGVLGPAIGIVKKEDITVTISDSTGRRIRTTPTRSMNTGQGGVTQGQKTEIKQVVGRLSWRQIFDYQEMKNN